MDGYSFSAGFSVQRLKTRPQRLIEPLNAASLAKPHWQPMAAELMAEQLAV